MHLEGFGKEKTCRRHLWSIVKQTHYGGTIQQLCNCNSNNQRSKWSAIYVNYATVGVVWWNWIGWKQDNLTKKQSTDNILGILDEEVTNWLEARLKLSRACAGRWYRGTWDWNNGERDPWKMEQMAWLAIYCRMSMKLYKNEDDLAEGEPRQ